MDQRLRPDKIPLRRHRLGLRSGQQSQTTYAGWNTPSPTVKGSSGFLELGWKSKINNSHPWGVDLKATGWTGKQEGGTFFATISHNF